MRLRLFVVMGVLMVPVAGGAGPPRGSAPRATIAPCRPGVTLTCEELVALGYTYPYERESGPYLFVNGAAHPYVPASNGVLAHGTVHVGGARMSVAKLLQTLGLEDRIGRPRTPVIAYGSNATVSALTRKYVNPKAREPAVIPVTRAQLFDYDVVWSPHLVFNGAMPATIVRSPGTVVEIWINWLDDVTLRRMHDSEEVGTFYSYGTLWPSRLVSDVPLAEPPHVYVDCHGALDLNGVLHAVAGVPAKRRRFPGFDSERAMQRIAPHIAWTSSVFDLLLDNVRSPERRASRSETLATSGRFVHDPAYQVECRCGATSCPVR